MLREHDVWTNTPRGLPDRQVDSEPKPSPVPVGPESPLRAGVAPAIALHYRACRRRRRRRGRDPNNHQPTLTRLGRTAPWLRRTSRSARVRPAREGRVRRAENGAVPSSTCGFRSRGPVCPGRRTGSGSFGEWCATSVEYSRRQPHTERQATHRRSRSRMKFTSPRSSSKSGWASGQTKGIASTVAGGRPRPIQRPPQVVEAPSCSEDLFVFQASLTVHCAMTTKKSGRSWFGWANGTQAMTSTPASFLLSFGGMDPSREVSPLP